MLKVGMLRLECKRILELQIMFFFEFEFVELIYYLQLNSLFTTYDNLNLTNKFQCPQREKYR